MYAFATKRKAELFDSHIEAFREYNDSKEKSKGVFAVYGNKIEGVNLSVNMYDGSLQELKNKIKETLDKENEVY